MQIRMTKEYGKEFAVFTCDGPQVGVIRVQPADNTKEGRWAIAGCVN